MNVCRKVLATTSRGEESAQTRNFLWPSRAVFDDRKSRKSPDTLLLCKLSWGLEALWLYNRLQQCSSIYSSSVDRVESVVMCVCVFFFFPFFSRLRRMLFP